MSKSLVSKSLEDKVDDILQRVSRIEGALAQASTDRSDNQQRTMAKMANKYVVVTGVIAAGISAFTSFVIYLIH